MSTISKGVADRVKISRTVTRAIDVHAAAVAEAVFTVFYPAGGKAEKADLEQHLLRLGGALSRATDDMREADLTLAAERADDAEPRANRDQAEVTLREVIQRARKGVELCFGGPALTRVGLASAAPTSQDKLVLFGENTARLLESGAAGKYRDDGFDIDIGQVANALREATEAFSRALQTVEQEVREEQSAVAARDAAVAQWQRVYSAVSTTFTAMARLAELDEIADRVRPTARRRTGLTEPADEGETGIETSAETSEDSASDG